MRRDSGDRGGVDQVDGSVRLLKDILQYELACAERYRRFVSLVMVNEAPDTKAQLKHVLADTARDSDLLVERDATFLILMSETDRKGARNAISRYIDREGDVHDFSFALVTFPNDSGTAETLMETAERRLQKATEEGPGTIVSGD